MMGGVGLRGKERERKGIGRGRKRKGEMGTEERNEGGRERA